MLSSFTEMQTHFALGFCTNFYLIKYTAKIIRSRFFLLSSKLWFNTFEILRLMRYFLFKKTGYIKGKITALNFLKFNFTGSNVRL